MYKAYEHILTHTIILATRSPIGGKGGKSGKWEMGNGSGDKGMTIVVVELMTASV